MSKLVYERETCSRCGGSGQYSYCQRYGTTCFKCGGTKRSTTRNGKKAAAAVQAFMAEHFSVTVEDLKPGDRFTDDTFGKVTVANVQQSGSSCSFTNDAGETVRRYYITIDLAKPAKSQFGPINSIEKLPGQKVVRAVGGAEWDAVVAFARTIKKGVEVVEVVKAVA